MTRSPAYVARVIPSDPFEKFRILLTIAKKSHNITGYYLRLRRVFESGKKIVLFVSTRFLVTITNPSKLRISGVLIIPGFKLLCQRGIRAFSHWKDGCGGDIQWKRDGYLVPGCRESDENMPKDLLRIPKGLGLNITWLSPEE